MRLQNTLHLGILLFLALFLIQCSADAPQDQTRFFATFEVRHLAEDTQLRGQASFVQGDSIATSTPISLENGIAFMGSGTQVKQLPNGSLRYETTLRTDYISPTRFSFTLPQQENITEIDLPMNGLEDFEVTSASKTDGLRIKIAGGLEKDESLLLLFTDPSQEAKTIVRPGPLTNKDLFIPADALLHFTSGEYRLFMVKSKEIIGQKDGIEYQAIVEFYTEETAFELMP